MQRWLTTAALTAVFLSLWPSPCGAGSGADGGPAKPSLLLITIDTWRWDHIGVSGAGKVRTPNLDALAREGVYDRWTVTPCPLTTPAHASLLTGLSPMRHGILDCVGYAMKPGVRTLAEEFAEAGYRTAAFISGDSLARRYGLNRGFEVYDDSGISKRSPDDWLFGTKDGALTTEAAAAYVRAHSGDPLFLWVHYFDLHEPYRRRPAYDGQYPGRPYAAQVAFEDEQVGKLLSVLRSDKGRQWRTVVVGDHGEGLGDHGELSHGMALYGSTLHVPLILYPKPLSPLRHALPWSLMDLAPTIREWFGLPRSSRQEGESLFGAGGEDRLIPVLTLMPTFALYVNPALGVRKGDFSYTRFGSEELYDLKADPGETRNLMSSPSHKKVLKELRAGCSAAYRGETLQTLVQPTLETSGEDLEALRGLGYIGGFAPKMAELQKAELRTVLADYYRLQRLKEESFRNRNPGQAVEAYAVMAARYPRAPGLLSNYGKVCLQAKDFVQAQKIFERVIRINPKDADALINLGTLYLAQGRPERAKVLLEAALQLNPDDTTCLENLGILYGDVLKQPEKAIPLFKRYLELEPGSPDAPKIRAFLAREEHNATTR